MQYQEESSLAILLRGKSQNREEPLDLGGLMKFPLLPVPPSLGIPDGFFTKANKAAIFHYFLFSKDCYHKDSIKTQERLRYPSEDGNSWSSYKEALRLQDVSC